MFENNSQYKNPYSMYDPSYIQKLEEENKRLKEQQQQMSDPTYVEFQNSREYQEAKKNNFLTFLLELTGAQWLNSPHGKSFAEWDKKQYQTYKESKQPKPTPAPAPQPMTQPQQGNYVAPGYTQPYDKQ